MSRPVPFSLDGAPVLEALEPAGNRLAPSDRLPKDGPWVPGENQNKAMTKSPTNHRGPAVKPRAPFVLR